jgi:serine/threonine protein kinase
MPGGLTGRVCPRCAAAFLKAAPTEMPGDATGSSRPFTPPPVAELAPLFPQLEILELIGQGGMGAVYKARQKELDRIVALKILPPGIGDAAFAERFAREAKALARLNHPGIVTIYEFGRSNGLFFFLMEFVDGVTLRHVLEAGRISPREALAIVPGICDALQYAHDQGIVHRDIKPENILLDRRGRTKVADFGLAKLVESGSAGSDFEVIPPAAASTVTHSGKVLGTPQYMAPEQFEHPAAVDHRADIYALGVVFYQMLTGELPGQRIEPPSRKVRIDVRLDEVVLRALEKNPDRRYAQASVFKTQVETIAQTEESRNRNPGTGQKMKTKTIFATLLSAVLCLGIGLAIWLVTRPRQFSMENSDSKTAQLSNPGTTAREAVQFIHTSSQPAQAIKTATGQTGAVEWNGNKIVSRILPYPDFISLFIRLPIAHAAATGRGVKVAVVQTVKDDTVLPWIQRVAPQAEIGSFVIEPGKAGGDQLHGDLLKSGCRIAMVCDPRWWPEAALIQLVQELTAAKVLVVVPSDLSEEQAAIGVVNRLQAMGCLTVGRVDRQSTVMIDEERRGGSARPFNRQIRAIHTDVFSTIGLRSSGPAVAAATAAGVAALAMEKWPELSPAEIRGKIVAGARPVWQATSLQTGRWQPVSVDPITTRYVPMDEQAIFRFRVLDAAGALGVDTEIPWFLNMLNCQKAWEISKGRGAVVVMSDQGFHIKHPDLIGRIQATEHFGPVTLDAPEQNFHGTDMSRILLAVAPEARIVPVLCSGTSLDANGDMADNIAKSFQYAADLKADVVSASWAQWFNTNEKLLAAVRNAVDHGVVVSWFHYPRAYPGLLRPTFAYAAGWDPGPQLGFADRFLTDPPGFHPVEIEAGLSGTAPQAAGIAALVKSVDAKLTPGQIEALIVQNATPIGGGILVPDVYNTLVAAAAAAAVSTTAVGRTDNIDLPFVNDPQVIGEWDTVDLVADISDFNPDTPNPAGGELFLKGLTFLENGKMPQQGMTWTKGVVMDRADRTASHYEIRQSNGMSYMFFEWKSGDYTIRGMKPIYYVLRKK